MVISPSVNIGQQMTGLGHKGLTPCQGLRWMGGASDDGVLHVVLMRDTTLYIYIESLGEQEATCHRVSVRNAILRSIEVSVCV